MEIIRDYNFWAWGRSCADEGIVNVTLPFSSLNWQWLPDEGIYADMLRNFDIDRLSGIRSLAAASFQSKEGIIHFMSSHTRLGHSLLVGMVMEHILMRNQMSIEVVNKGIAAGLLHDIATPAWGDPIMFIDPKNLNEENRWREFLTDRGQRVLSHYEITPEELDGIITNNGLLGRVLDIADRITYVCQDIHSVNVAPRIETRGNPYINKLAEFTPESSPLGDIYQDIVIENNEVYFSNPERLERFLKARVFLHKQYYLHPASQVRDMIMGNLVKKFYSTTDSDLLTPRKLRSMTDLSLSRWIAEHYEPAWNVPDCFDMWGGAGYKRLCSEDNQEEITKGLEENPWVVVIGKRKIRAINPAFHYKVKEDRRIVSFSEYNPEAVQEIKELADSIPGEYLLYGDVEDSLSVRDLLTEMKRDNFIGFGCTNQMNFK